jgi:hypothetical protein
VTLDLDPIKAREAAATPGPWAIANVAPAWASGRDEWNVVPGVIDQCTSAGCGPIVEPADADFIAHARTDVPALLAEVERLRAELAARADDTPNNCLCGDPDCWDGLA